MQFWPLDKWRWAGKVRRCPVCGQSDRNYKPVVIGDDVLLRLRALLGIIARDQSKQEEEDAKVSKKADSN